MYSFNVVFSCMLPERTHVKTALMRVFRAAHVPLGIPTYLAES